MSLLFSPLTIRSINLKNRIVVSPMCQYSSVDGFANDWHLVHLGSRAVGGAGLVMQEATAITADGRISYGDIGIWKDEHIEKLSAITGFIHEQGSVAGIQLAHAGRKASTDLPWISDQQLKTGENAWQTISASAIPYRDNDIPPVALDIAGIKQVIEDFRQAAIRAHKAGYRVVEIHAAHGYLINQFLSPLTNHRTDEYGGSFDNRIRFLMEVTDAIQTVWPAELPLFARLSATDWVEGGWTIDDSVQLSKRLKEKGVDLVDASSGGTVPNAVIPVGLGYQVPLATDIKKESGLLTGAVGLIVSATQAEEILQQQKADLIFMAREHLRDPYFALRAAAEMGEDVVWPKQYLRAKRNKKS